MSGVRRPDVKYGTGCLYELGQLYNSAETICQISVSAGFMDRTVEERRHAHLEDEKCSDGMIHPERHVEIVV